jgi:predicted nucleic acid-binding protein
VIIVLDTFPASSAAKRPGARSSLLDQCREWIRECEAAGHTVLVPAIAYYEVLRELELRGATGQIARLRSYCTHPDRSYP